MSCSSVGVEDEEIEEVGEVVVVVGSGLAFGFLAMPVAMCWVVGGLIGFYLHPLQVLGTTKA